MTGQSNQQADMHPGSVLEFRVSNLEVMVGEIRSAVKGIDGSLKILAALEARHAQTSDAVARAFTELKDHEDRLRSAESDLPTMRLVRNWVIAGVIGCTSMVGVAAAGLVIVSAKAQPPTVQQQGPRG